MGNEKSLENILTDRTLSAVGMRQNLKAWYIDEAERVALRAADLYGSLNRFEVASALLGANLFLSLVGCPALKISPTQAIGPSALNTAVSVSIGCPFDAIQSTHGFPDLITELAKHFRGLCNRPAQTQKAALWPSER